MSVIFPFEMRRSGKKKKRRKVNNINNEFKHPFWNIKLLLLYDNQSRYVWSIHGKLGWWQFGGQLCCHNKAVLVEDMV